MTQTIDTRGPPQLRHLRLPRRHRAASASSPSPAPPTCGSTSPRWPARPTWSPLPRRRRPGLRRRTSVFCLQAGQAPTATHTFPALPAGTYHVIVAVVPRHQGATTVTPVDRPLGHAGDLRQRRRRQRQRPHRLRRSALQRRAELRRPSSATPDINLGALVVGAPPKTANFDTHDLENRYHPTCAGASAGNDVVVRFTLARDRRHPRPAGPRRGDHVIASSHAAGPGRSLRRHPACPATTPAAPGGNVAFAPRPARRLHRSSSRRSRAGDEGRCRHRRSRAFKNRQHRDLHTTASTTTATASSTATIPACFGVGGCTRALLHARRRPRRLRRRATPKTRDARHHQRQRPLHARCAKGGGKEQGGAAQRRRSRWRSASTAPQTGDHVLAADAPRIRSTPATPTSSTAPIREMLPFGCNFDMPNIQPGTYNVIVEAFRAGAEGTVEPDALRRPGERRSRSATTASTTTTTASSTAST